MQPARAGLALGLMLAALSPLCAQADVCLDAPILREAAYAERSRAYGHGAVADGEWAQLRYIVSARGTTTTITVVPPEGVVFEGPRPLVTDPCGGLVVAVESSLEKGSRVVWFDPAGIPVARGDWVGTPHRWISLVGTVTTPRRERRAEVATLAIDRPHLRGDLLLLERRGARLRSTVLARGLSNHRLGAADTLGGARACPGVKNSFVLATLDWSAVVRIEVDPVNRSARETARFAGSGPKSFAAAMACD